MNKFQEKALAIVAEALGESGTLHWEDPETVRITINRGPSFTLRMALRREDDPSAVGLTPTLWILRRPCAQRGGSDPGTGRAYRPHRPNAPRQKHSLKPAIGLLGPGFISRSVVVLPTR